MLFAEDGSAFTTSRVSYRDIDPDGIRRHSAIYLQVSLPFMQGISVSALVDTGSPYCIFDTELLSVADIDFSAGEPIILSTRVGRIEGNIQRLPLIIAAEEGTSLMVEASIFVTKYWQHGNFLGYGGFLERLRFAIDPLSNNCYFGPGG